MGRPVVGPTTFIVSRHADPAFVREAPTIYGAGTAPPLEQIIRQQAAKEYGGAPADYAVIWNSDEITLERLRKGATHTVSWDGVSEENDAVYDFKAEDSKRVIRCTASKPSFIANNTDTVTITCRAHVQNPDGTAGAVDASVNATRLLPIRSPLGRRYVQITFINGEATFDIKGNGVAANGDWAVPDPAVADGNSKIDDQSTVQIKGFVTSF